MASPVWFGCSCGLWNDRQNDQLSKQRLGLPARMPRRPADLVVGFPRAPPNCSVRSAGRPVETLWTRLPGPVVTLDVDAQARLGAGSSSSSSLACSSSGVMSASASTSNGWPADTTRPRRCPPRASRARLRPPPRRSARPAGPPPAARRGSAGRCAPTGRRCRRLAAPRPAAAPPTGLAGAGRRPGRSPRRCAGRRRRPHRPVRPPRFAGVGLQQPLEPGSLAGEQRSCLGLVHLASSDRVKGSSCELADHRQACRRRGSTGR